jgi:hypothetical protein
MLASAFGTLHSDVSEYNFRALQLWQLEDRDIVLPWSGGDSHCSIKDIWAARPGLQAEDKVAETRAAELVTNRQTQQDAWATNIENDAHLCKFDDCPRGGHGQGFGSYYSLMRHLESHKTEDDGYLCQVEDCPRAAPGKGFVSAQALLYHQKSHYHINADSYPCTEPDCGRSEPGKGCRDSTHLARHMDSHDRGVAGSQPLKRHTQTSCSDPRCDHVTNPFFYAKHEEQHLDGRFACRACGLKYYHAATANEHALNECRVEDAATIHIPMTAEMKRYSISYNLLPCSKRTAKTLSKGIIFFKSKVYPEKAPEDSTELGALTG